MRSRNIIWMTGISSLLLLAGCAAQPAAAPVEVPAAVATAAEAPLPPTPLPTFTPLPTTAPTPTPNPPAKLTVEELNRRLDPLGSDPCLLPCYGGLTVGQADLDAAFAFYAGLGIGTSDLMPGDYDNVHSGTGHLHAWLNKASDQAAAEAAGYAPPLVDLVLKDGLVSQVYVGWTQIPDTLDVARILEALGEPDVFEGAVVQDEGASTYMLRLIYQTLQADFVYYGAPEAGEICITPETVQQMLFGVWESNTGPKEGLVHSDSLLPIETLTGLTAAENTAWLEAGQCLNIAP